MTRFRVTAATLLAGKGALGHGAEELTTQLRFQSCILKGMYM